MADMVELLNICNYCAYAPCICGNEPENCANYVQRHGIELRGEDGADNGWVYQNGSGNQRLAERCP